MKRAMLVLALAACGEDATISIVPVLELPTDEDADALPELTQIRISLEGTTLDAIFSKGQDIVLDDVPLTGGLVLQLDGFSDLQGVAVGRTCPFSLADGNRPSPRLYLSQVVRTGLLAQQAAGRLGGAALTLADDSVLLLGGEGSSVVERYDPRTATLIEVEHEPFEGRTGAAIALYEDGRPAIIGGLVNGVPATDALLVSSSGVVEQIPDVSATVDRSNLTATALADGQILITGGRDPAGVASNKVVRMRTKNTIITLETVNSTTLVHAREGHVVTALGDGGASLLISGGNDSAGVVAQSELYRVVDDESIALESPKFDLKFPRTGHRAVLLPDESVVIIGGVDAAGNPVRALERFSLIEGMLPVIGGILPDDAPAIDFSLVTLPDGSVLMAGGREREGAAAQTNVFLILFDPGTGGVQLAPRDELAIPRADPQLSVLCDGTVLISGGTQQPDFVERFNPNVRPLL